MNPFSTERLRAFFYCVPPTQCSSDWLVIFFELLHSYVASFCTSHDAEYTPNQLLSKRRPH